MSHKYNFSQIHRISAKEVAGWNLAAEKFLFSATKDYTDAFKHKASDAQQPSESPSHRQSRLIGTEDER